VNGQRKLATSEWDVSEARTHPTRKSCGSLSGLLLVALDQFARNSRSGIRDVLVAD